MSGESSKARIAILISGRGSNMIALADAVRDGIIPDAEIAVVISDQPNAAGLAKAAERGIETLIITRRGRPREEHDREIITALRERNVDLASMVYTPDTSTTGTGTSGTGTGTGTGTSTR